MRRMLVTALRVLSAVMLFAMISAGIAGCDSRYPLEFSYGGIDYSRAVGGNMWAIHLGTYAGGVYLSWNQLEPSSRTDPYLQKDYRRLAGWREWHARSVDNLSDQPLVTTMPDTRCTPPQTGHLLAPNWSTLGVRAYHFSEGGKAGFAIVLPCLALVVVTTIAPMLWLRRRLVRWRRRAHGQCPCCGYDLRQSPDRCPECGAIPSPPQRTR